jgi:hypothetical protein
MDPEIETKARKIQARLIEKTDKTWSISIILNILAMAGFSQAKKMSKQDWQEAFVAVAQKTVKIDDSAVSDIVKKLS